MLDEFLATKTIVIGAPMYNFGIASQLKAWIDRISIAGKTLSRVGQVQLDPVPGPVDVAISPDGTTALVTQCRGTSLWRLAINGTSVTTTGTPFFDGTTLTRDGAATLRFAGRPGAIATARSR